MKELFSGTNKIFVFGDVILDVYNFGKVERISPEAPVPVVHIRKVRKTLGGAANVANNMVKLKMTPVLFGCIGSDIHGKELIDLLNAEGVNNYLKEDNFPTTSKVRIIAGSQQIVRVDTEEARKFPSCSNALSQIDALCEDCKVLVISDYGKGMVSFDISRYLISKAKDSGKILIVDPKGSNWEKYRGATVITPNLKELSDVYGEELENEDEVIEAAAKDIMGRFDLPYLLVTRSEKGMSLICTDYVFHVKSKVTEVFDVSGAGDTVVATLAVGLSSGLDWKVAVQMANQAAGIVVGKMGTAPVLYDELMDSLSYSGKRKIYDAGEIKLILQKLNRPLKKIVFTNGCFDIIHKGHIQYLKEAKKMGDTLIVGLNSDDSVRRLKGNSRPIKKEDERALIVSALEFVDYVVIFNSDTPLDLIKVLQPDILVKGGDYTVESVVGREYAKSVRIIPFVNGYSTTSTVDQLRNDKK